MTTGTLTFFCGKMGAGKSTKAGEIARQQNAVLLSEDQWLAALYPGQITSLGDYVHYSNLLKPPIKQLVQSMLAAGTHVVMDFPANTFNQRGWFQQLFSEIKAPHQLIWLDIEDNVCLQRIAQRSIEQPQRAATDTPEMFAAMNQYFVAPQAEEGFNVIRMAHGCL
ncbi:AAA family ATPase [Oceanobacter mangrovi]|uniref:AAA family ATPase n=1 Tax=Oceanobacter mangrovi TaxID=2862510 RepID=UPI001C8D5CD0|nr:ATP-binding protein [Oceanobacter mangrovi]